MSVGGFIGEIIGGAATGGIGPAIGQAMSAAAQPVAETAKLLVDRLVPDPKAKADAQREVELILAQREAVQINAAKDIAVAQANINLAEAQGTDPFSSRWRPFIGWVCGLGLGYNFLVAPSLTFFINIVNAAANSAVPPAPTGDLTDLFALIIPLLGLGAMRTTERVKGVQTAQPPAA